jgi:hypothetical protein
MRLRTFFSILSLLTALAIGPGALADELGAACGGVAGAKCGAGLYCDFGDGQALKPSSCGHADHPGQCAKIPQICTDEVKWVCGCDGKRYSNACEAHRKGVTVAIPGKCFAPPHNEPPPGANK